MRDTDFSNNAFSSASSSLLLLGCSHPQLASHLRKNPALSSKLVCRDFRFIHPYTLVC